MKAICFKSINVTQPRKIPSGGVARSDGVGPVTCANNRLQQRRPLTNPSSPALQLMSYLNLKKHRRPLLTACGLLSALLLPTISWAQVANRPAPVIVTVNSPADGPLLADAQLTLREAIEITNGTLPVSALSSAEQQQVRPGSTGFEILFDLPVGQTTIELGSVLPAIATPNTRIDATTQPGYDATTSATAEIAIPVPVVVLRPQADRENLPRPDALGGWHCGTRLEHLRI